MSEHLTLREKLEKNAIIVDTFISKLLEPRKPEILYDASSYLIKAGGKRARPFLLIKSCEAVGGNINDALPFAAALEILHNFTLVHDDVMDNDSLRRGAPTVHVKWGTPLAIAAGDLLFAKVYDSMINYSAPKFPESDLIACIKKVTESTIRLCEGQVLDISYPRTIDVSEEDYILMVGGKTSSLFNACAEIGAILGGGSDEEINALGVFGWKAGIAFQLYDDILGATATEEILGKPVGSDFREGKKTLLMIHALEKASSKQKSIILNVLGNKEASKEEIKEVSDILYDLGSIDYVNDKAEYYIQKALSSLSMLPETDAKKDLKDLVDYFIHRKN